MEEETDQNITGFVVKFGIGEDSVNKWRCVCGFCFKDEKIEDKNKRNSFKKGRFNLTISIIEG